MNRRSTILDWALAHPGSSNREIADALGYSVASVNNHAKQLVAERQLSRRKESAPKYLNVGEWHYYPPKK